MSDEFKRGVAICHYNRLDQLPMIIDAVKLTVPESTKIVVCDDGSGTRYSNETYLTNVAEVTRETGVVLIQGPNLGVAANKNRALWALQDCHFICILEDDLIPKQPGWFTAYEKAMILSGCHHFCRIQAKTVSETVPSFTTFMRGHGLTPIYASSPRGDLTFLTQEVIRKVGAFNPKFRGAGYAHGEWSERVAKAGLIGHPLKWIDIKEARDSFKQIGDREGGRWQIDEKIIKEQLKKNARVRKELDVTHYIHHPLLLE